jgi:hypothetical protein
VSATKEEYRPANELISMACTHSCTDSSGQAIALKLDFDYICLAPNTVGTGLSTTSHMLRAHNP